MNRVYKFFGGRTMTFLWVCMVSGIVLAAYGKLTWDFSALVGALFAGQVVRARGQDGINPKNGSNLTGD